MELYQIVILCSLLYLSPELLWLVTDWWRRLSTRDRLAWVAAWLWCLVSVVTLALAWGSA